MWYQQPVLRQVAVATVLMLTPLMLMGCPTEAGDVFVSVPNVVGASEASAQASIVAAGLSVGSITDVYSDSVPVGRVVSQNPSAGSTVLEGSNVNLAISLGPSTDPQAEYDEGFDDGFAEDDEYWQGFDDSWDTRDGGEIYYTGHLIPEYDDPPYDAGYWDGVWYAYNDGYFVAYDYAFTIGFSEGYDAAFASDYAQFLNSDEHEEWLDGGFTDGYNDGFSEGRVFGAYDYANSLPFDWLDAMLDYRDGTDLTVAGVSTGAAGPVTLYEYGTNPFDLVKGVKKLSRDIEIDRPVPSIRNSEKQDEPEISYRPLRPEVQTELNVRPNETERGGRDVSISATWLQRVNEYRAALGQ